MARYKYVGETPAFLPELQADLEPGQDFDAPADWKPSPHPHPLFERLDKPVVIPAPPADTDEES